MLDLAPCLQTGEDPRHRLSGDIAEVQKTNGPDSGAVAGVFLLAALAQAAGRHHTSLKIARFFFLM